MERIQKGLERGRQESEGQTGQREQEVEGISPPAALRGQNTELQLEQEREARDPS